MSTITSAETTVAPTPPIATSQPQLKTTPARMQSAIMNSLMSKETVTTDQPETQGVGKTMPDSPQGGKTIKTEDGVQVKTEPDDDSMAGYPQKGGKPNGDIKAEVKIEGGKDGEKQIKTEGDDMHSAVKTEDGGGDGSKIDGLKTEPNESSDSSEIKQEPMDTATSNGTPSTSTTIATPGQVKSRIKKGNKGLLGKLRGVWGGGVRKLD